MQQQNPRVETATPRLLSSATHILFDAAQAWHTCRIIGYPHAHGKLNPG
jgi:hypothetical protein